eukprot:5508052-Pyramimonas_sp.AAC.1
MPPLMPHRSSTAHIHWRLSDGKAAAMSMRAKTGMRDSASAVVLSLRASASTIATLWRNWRLVTKPCYSSEELAATSAMVWVTVKAKILTSAFFSAERAERGG